MAGNQEYRKTYAYRKWSITVRRRDGQCRCCTSRKNGEAHHIMKSADHPELRLDVDNGVRFCSDCHDLFHVDICGGHHMPIPYGALEYFLAKFSTSRRRDYKRAKKYRKKMGIK